MLYKFKYPCRIRNLNFKQGELIEIDTRHINKVLRRVYIDEKGSQPQSRYGMWINVDHYLEPVFDCREFWNAL